MKRRFATRKYFTRKFVSRRFAGFSEFIPVEITSVHYFTLYGQELEYPFILFHC
jgi:hypothetical protein